MKKILLFIFLVCLFSISSFSMKKIGVETCSSYGCYCEYHYWACGECSSGIPKICDSCHCTCGGSSVSYNGYYCLY